MISRIQKGPSKRGRATGRPANVPGELSLPVHASVAPTRQAVVMMQVVVGACNDHVVNVLATVTLVNGAAQRMRRRHHPGLA